MSTTRELPSLTPFDSLGVSEEHPTALAARIATRFELARPVEAFDFPEKGNINRDTYLVVAGPATRRREYLLQRINDQVFTRPDAVMAAMCASLEAQRAVVAGGRLPSDRIWEAIELVPTRAGDSWLECDDRRGSSTWRLMVKIVDCRAFKSLADVGSREGQLALAREAGRGLAIYGDLTAGMDVSRLRSPLPGYRDTRLYYAQLHSALEGCASLAEAAPWLPDDDEVRESTAPHFVLRVGDAETRRRREMAGVEHAIDVAVAEEEFALTLLRGLEDGSLRTVAIHGDTKLENFLFAPDGRVKSLVDLDTIMPHTWLADWGDMVRSLANVAGEKATDVSFVRVDLEIYEAVARGFLDIASAATPEEIAFMPEAVEIIALELGVRYLADFLRGDTYFKLGPADPPDLNRVRALVQFRLFEDLRSHREELRAIVRDLAARREDGGDGCSS